MPVSRKNPKRGKKKPTSQKSRESQRKAKAVKQLKERPQDIEELFKKHIQSFD